MVLKNGLCWNPRWEVWMKAPQPSKPLPYDEIASRYLAGESLKQILADYPNAPNDEAVRRLLIRRGVRKKRIPAAGPNNSQWKGGYKAPMHFYRRQSYEVAAICQGRPLEKGEVIHHIDENAENNNPENLMIFPNQNHHAHFHQTLLKRLQKDGTVDTIQLALEIGARQLQRPACLIEWSPDIMVHGPSEKRYHKTVYQPGQIATLLLEPPQ